MGIAASRNTCNRTSVGDCDTIGGRTDSTCVSDRLFSRAAADRSLKRISFESAVCPDYYPWVVFLRSDFHVHAKQRASEVHSVYLLNSNIVAYISKPQDFVRMMAFRSEPRQRLGVSNGADKFSIREVAQKLLIG